MHLSTGRKENEIAYLNRAHRSNHLLNALNSSNSYYARPDDNNGGPSGIANKKSLIEPFLIKNIYLKLIIPKFVIIQQQKREASFFFFSSNLSYLKKY